MDGRAELREAADPDPELPGLTRLEKWVGTGHTVAHKGASGTFNKSPASPPAAAAPPAAPAAAPAAAEAAAPPTPTSSSSSAMIAKYV